MTYKLWIEGEAKGPCTLEDLRVMWEEGDIDGQTLYAEEGMDDYKPLSGLAGVLNIPEPEEQSSPQVPLPAEESTAPAQNADAAPAPAEKTNAKPIPVLVIYGIGAIVLGTGVFLLLSRDQDSMLDTDADLSLVQIGVFALLAGYLCDLVAQCLYELKESNRWWRKID